MEHWKIREQVEKWRAEAEKQRRETQDFTEKNIICAREMALEQVLVLLRPES